MPSGVASACINHPSIEAVGRCKQCGKPFCGACRVQGPTGYFCSQPCQQKHEQFTSRAQQLDKMSKSGGFMTKLWWLGKKVIFFAILLLIIVFVAAFFGIKIPIATDLVDNILKR